MRAAAALVGARAARATRLAARSAPVSLGLPALLVLAVWLAFFNQLDGFPLFDVDEGAFSESTREMLARGDYVTTWLNGEPRFDKPILTYWLQALSVLLFGAGEFSFRLPSALAAVGWMAAILVFTRQQSDCRSACVAALIAATSVGVGVIARAATADALLNLFLALAMFDIYRFMEQPLARYRRRAYLWIALGVLTKGPVALLIPFAVSAIAFALHGKARQWRDAILDPAGWGILLAVAAPWYVIEYVRQGDAFIAGFFLRHNVERFMAPLQGHRGNPLYYLPAALLLLLPYSGMFLRILPGVMQLRARPLDTFLWCWFLFVLVFFSLAATKLPHYLLYGVTPLFVLMALRRRLLQSRALAFLPPILLLAAVVALPAALQTFGHGIGDPYVREALTRSEAFGPRYQRVAPALLLCCLVLAFVPRYQVWQKLVACGVLCAAAVGGLLLPALGELQQGPVKEAALFARAAGLQVRTWQFNVPSFSVYRGKVTEGAVTLRPGEVVLTRSSKLAGLGAVDVLYRKGGVLLVRIPR
ncbi:MAG: glycosyltransferase family 39 protein [Pseudomonadota bacterium]